MPVSFKTVAPPHVEGLKLTFSFAGQVLLWHGPFASVTPEKALLDYKTSMVITPPHTPTICLFSSASQHGSELKLLLVLAFNSIPTMILACLITTTLGG